MNNKKDSRDGLGNLKNNNDFEHFPVIGQFRA